MKRHTPVPSVLMLIAVMIPVAAQTPTPPASAPTGSTTPQVSGKKTTGGKLTPADMAYNQAVKDFNAANASNDSVLLAQAQKELQAIAATPKSQFSADVNMADIHGLLGYIALKQSDTTTAVSELQTTVSLSPNDLSARNNLGNALQQSGKYADAAAQYQFILDHQALIDPVTAKTYNLDMNRVQFNQATALAQAGQYDASFKIFQTILASKPDAVTYSNYGYFLQKAGKKAEAADAMNQAATLNPKDAQSWLNVGLLYADLGQNDQATAALAKAVGPDVDPKLDTESEYNAYFTLGQIYAANKEPNQAIKEFATASQLHPQDIAPLYNMAALQEQAGRLTEAEQSYRQVLTIKPDDSQTLTNLGLLLADDGKTKEATQVLAQAIQQDPTSAPAHARLADLYAQQGDTTDALNERRAALQLEPGNDDTRLALADTYLSQRQYGPALVQYDIVARHRPHDVGVLNSRGLAYVQIKNYGAAFSSFRQALAVNPRNAEAENNLGVIYEKQGHKAEALVAYKKAAALDPTLLQARENLMRLTGK